MNLSRSRQSVVVAALCAASMPLVAGCAPEAADEAMSAAPALPQWTYDSSAVFPADRSLVRPEDGIALPDGRLIVGDQEFGLRLVEIDGTSAPFGDLAAAGYTHGPPEHPGGDNGVSLEPGGTHLLLADVFNGAIYRVDVSSGAAEKVYQHSYGINTAVRDSRGAIWFTQSSHNTPEEGEARLWANVDIMDPEGALLRLGSEGGQLDAVAEVIVDSLLFANGVVLDETNGHIYVAETGGRVLRYNVDLDAGQVSERTVFADGVMADNLELDSEGYLWVARPLRNEVLVVNTATGERHTVYSSLTPEQQEVAEEWVRRGEAGTSRLELFTPAQWAPLPGPITGVILGPDGAVYFTGLGSAVMKYTR